MLELIATLVVDLSDQTLTVLNEQDQTVRVIPVSTGKASSPTPTGHASGSPMAIASVGSYVAQ